MTFPSTVAILERRINRIRANIHRSKRKHMSVELRKQAGVLQDLKMVHHAVLHPDEPVRVMDIIGPLLRVKVDLPIYFSTVEMFGARLLDSQLIRTPMDVPGTDIYWLVKGRLMDSTRGRQFEIITDKVTYYAKPFIHPSVVEPIEAPEWFRRKIGYRIADEIKELLREKS